MARLQAIQAQASMGKAKELLEGVQAKLGITPNMTKVMANSPAVLQAYLAFVAALSAGMLSTELREQLALANGEENSCQYCVSAHTAIGKIAGLSDAEIASAREAKSDAPKNAAALRFAQAVVAKRGMATDADLQAIRAAGFTDGEIAEIIAHVALNTFTNYFNNTAEVEVDFPKVALRRFA